MKAKKIHQEVDCTKLVKKKQLRPDSMDYALFVKDLEKLINKKSLENGSNTPDYILADYLTYCLKTFDYAIRRYENKKWNIDDNLNKFLQTCLQNLDDAIQKREKHYGRRMK